MASQSIPRWKSAISNALVEHEKSTVIQLASIDPTTPVPHVRSHIFRGFITASSSTSLPVVLTSTDIRTPKTSQIISNPHVQLAWWIEGTQEQFRISGLASVIPAPTHGLYKHFLHNLKTAPPGSGIAALSKEDFDWEQKRKEMFSSMSAHMKATWCRPAPGSRLENPEEAKKWPEKVDNEGDVNWETALGNFALVVVDPTEVDYVELGPTPHRRTRFWRRLGGIWEEEAIVP